MTGIGTILLVAGVGVPLIMTAGFAIGCWIGWRLK